MRTSGTAAALTTALLLGLGLGLGAGPVAAATDMPPTVETVVRDDFDQATSRTWTRAVPGEQGAAATARPAPAAHRAYLAIVTGPGSYSGVTPDDLRARVGSALDYWVDQSDRVISAFTVAASATYVSSRATLSNGCGMASSTAAEQVWGEAASKFPGVTFTSSNGNHLIVVLPDECATGAVGLGSVGTGLASGGRVLAEAESGAARTTLVHEIGHNLSLGHADAETCPSATSCSTTQYADLYDPMGFSTDFGASALSSAHRADLDLLDTTESPRVELAADQSGTSATFQLVPRASASGVRSVTAIEPGTGVQYQVDLRQPVGRDATAWWVPRPVIDPGLVFGAGVTVTSRGERRRTLLRTRSYAGQYRTSFAPGETFTSASGALSVTVVSTMSGAAEVRVGLGTGTETATAPPVATPGPAAPAVFDAGRPDIRGRARVGRTVRVDPDAYPAGTTLAVRWLVGGQPVRGATSTTLKLKRKLRGAVLTVQVTATAPGYAAETDTSRAVKVRG